MDSPIVVLDLHGLRTEEAKRKIDAAVAAAGTGVYRIRLIHGYHRGNAIRSMIYEEYRFGREPKVLRVVPGDNEGITELVLREY